MGEGVVDGDQLAVVRRYLFNRRRDVVAELGEPAAVPRQVVVIEGCVEAVLDDQGISNSAGVRERQRGIEPEVRVVARLSGGGLGVAQLVGARRGYVVHKRQSPGVAGFVGLDHVKDRSLYPRLRVVHDDDVRRSDALDVRGRGLVGVGVGARRENREYVRAVARNLPYEVGEDGERHADAERAGGRLRRRRTLARAAATAGGEQRGENECGDERGCAGHGRRCVHSLAATATGLRQVAQRP